jgi:NAD+ synthase
MNEKLLEEIKNQDYTTITKKIDDFLKNQVTKNNANGLILGLSGGIDSAVITYLCSRVLKDKTLAMIMPDSKISPKKETEEALKIIEKLGTEYKLLDINPIVSEYSKYIEPNERALGNLRARVRANLLYYYANSKNLLVVGSSDKSEFLIGYFTKFGDGSADILPIVSLYKIQVRELARFLGVPESIITQKSSPNLWKGHSAEEEIGVQYEEIDSILYCMFEKKLSIEETVKATNIEKNTVDKIYQLYKTSEHKRITAARP